MRLLPRRFTSKEKAALVVAPPAPLAAESELGQLFSDAYRRLHGPMLRHAERYLDRESARDAAADAVANIWYRWAALTPAQRTDAYFFRAVHNSVIDALRANKSSVSLDDAEVELERLAARSVEAPTSDDTAADVLDLAFAVMPPRRREVFLLVHEHDLSYKEAAEELGLSPATVNVHVSQANADLRQAFTRAGFRVSGSVHLRQLPPARGASHD